MSPQDCVLLLLLSQSKEWIGRGLARRAREAQQLWYAFCLLVVSMRKLANMGYA